MSAGKDKYFPKIGGQNIKLVRGIDIGEDNKLMKDKEFVFNGYTFKIETGKEGTPITNGTTHGFPEMLFHPTVTRVIGKVPAAAIGAAAALRVPLPPSRSSSPAPSSGGGGSSSRSGSTTPGSGSPTPRSGSSSGGGSPTPRSGSSSGGGSPTPRSGSSSPGGSPTPIGAVGGAAGAAAAASPRSGKGRAVNQKGGTSPSVETFLADAGTVSTLRKRKTRKNINRRN